MWNKIKSRFSLFSILGLVIGGIGGWVYYYQVGCNSGSCPIWSNPWISILWGAIFGYLVGDLFKRKPRDKQPQA
ncbi:MAG: hypothetical protein AB9842_00365 [Bacteroidales bacterium]